MFISRYDDYLVVSRKEENRNACYTEVCAGDVLHTKMNVNTIIIEKVNTYEIYTCHPETGDTGWDIHHVESTDDLIKYYPNFDCIITKNDRCGAACIEFTHSGWEAYQKS
jgi:hypothetical protein